MKEWSEAILEAVNSLGNEASLKAIYETLEKHFPLSNRNLRETRYGGRPAYQHEVRSFVSHLVKGGDLEWIGRGRYKLIRRGAGRLRAWMQADGRTLHRRHNGDREPESPQYLVTVEMQSLEDGRYLAIATNLPGAHAEGHTIAEAIENLEDIARITIELCREKNLPLPHEFHGEASTPLIKAEVLVKIDT